jgi:hypothetical protein
MYGRKIIRCRALNAALWLGPKRQTPGIDIGSLISAAARQADLANAAYTLFNGVSRVHR